MKKPITYEARLQKRREFAEVIHEYGFYVSLAFTILFFWNLGGGKPVWIAAFVAMGIGIDYTKKTQLDLAAVTVDKRERRGRKFIAFVMLVFSLLAGLGSALLRVNSIAAVQAAQADTSAIDEQIALWKTEYEVQINQVNTSTRVEWRDASQAKADRAMSEIARLLEAKSQVVNTSANVEQTAGMFTLMARFFGNADPDVFMVILLMLAVVSVEVSIWVTTPQYWKDRVADLGEKERQAAEARHDAQLQTAQKLRNDRDIAIAKVAAKPAVEKPKPKPDPVLSEKLLVVQPPKKADTRQGTLFD